MTSPNAHGPEWPMEQLLYYFPFLLIPTYSLLLTITQVEVFFKNLWPYSHDQ